MSSVSLASRQLKMTEESPKTTRAQTTLPALGLAALLRLVDKAPLGERRLGQVGPVEVVTRLLFDRAEGGVGQGA